MTVTSKNIPNLEPPIEFLFCRKFEIFSYILKKFENSNEPSYRMELANYFDMRRKLMGEYICQLKEMGYIVRFDKKRPKPIYPTLEGMKDFYCQIMTKLPVNLQGLIEEYISQIEEKYTSL
ncbi:MAG: hypothetical protein ACFFDF_12315 [Candidatus Odinarchaeota archaeon]